MKSIIYIITQLANAGPTRVLYDIIKHLDCTRYNPIVYKLTKDIPSRDITPKFIELKAEVREFNFSYWKMELQTKKCAAEVREALKQYEAPILHVHGYHPVLISSFLEEYPSIVTLHNISAEDYLLTFGFFQGKYMQWRYMRALKKISMYVAISDSVKMAYRGILDEVKLTRIYNGSSINWNEKYSKRELRMRLGLPIDKRIFVTVGALSKRKDPMTIIRAFQHLTLKEKVNNYLLLFIGVGDKEQVCRDLIGDNENIQLLGYKFNVEDYFHAADYSICASHSEGFGLNFVESLMCGTLVIGSVIPPFLEFMNIAPELKEYSFTPGNEMELVSVIRKKMELSSINTEQIAWLFQDEFSATSMSSNYMSLYQEIHCE